MEQGPPGTSEQNQGQGNAPQEQKGNGHDHGEQQAQQMQGKDQQSQQMQGKDEGKDQQPQEEKGKEAKIATILKLDLQPIHLDLLGLVLKTDHIHVELDAEAGEGKLLGNLLLQLLPLVDKLHLEQVVGEITSVVQDTLKGLAHEAGGKVKEQGTQIIGGLVGSAADKLKGRLHIPGGGNGQHAPAPAEGH